MIKTLLTPPPCPSYWQRDEGWLLLLAHSSTNTDQLISLPHGASIPEGEALCTWLKEAHAPLQKLNTQTPTLYHVIPRPELVTLTERGSFGSALQALAQGLSPERVCYQITSHQVSAALYQALSLIVAAGVPFKVSAPLSAWRQVALQELEVLLNAHFNAEQAFERTFELLEGDEERPLMAHLERSPLGCTLSVTFQGEKHTLYQPEGGLSREVWEALLKELSFVSGLPLWTLTQGVSTPDPSLDPSLPEVRDSLYMMDYDDAPSQQSDFGTLPIDVPLDDLEEDSAEEGSAEEGATEEGSAEKSPTLDFEADEESSVFTELSLSEVEPHHHTEQDAEELLTPSPMERKLQEQLKQAKAIQLAPSSSFDLSAINLSESQLRAETSVFSPPDVGPTEPHLSMKGDPFIEDHHTFNEFPQDDPTLHRDLSESDHSMGSSAGLDVASAPTRVDLNRGMVEEALAQLAEDELTSTDAPPVPDYALSSAPTRARPLIKSSISVPPSMSPSKDHPAHIHEEATKVSELNTTPPVLTEEAKERRKSFSDVVRRLKGHSQR